MMGVKNRDSQSIKWKAFDKRLEESIFTVKGHFSSLPRPATFRDLNTLCAMGTRSYFSFGTVTYKTPVWKRQLFEEKFVPVL